MTSLKGLLIRRPVRWPRHRSFWPQRIRTQVLRDDRFNIARPLLPRSGSETNYRIKNNREIAVILLIIILPVCLHNCHRPICHMSAECLYNSQPHCSSGVIISRAGISTMYSYTFTLQSPRVSLSRSFQCRSHVCHASLAHGNTSAVMCASTIWDAYYMLLTYLGLGSAARDFHGK